MKRIPRSQHHHLSPPHTLTTKIFFASIKRKLKVFIKITMKNPVETLAPGEVLNKKKFTLFGLVFSLSLFARINFSFLLLLPAPP